MRSAQIIVHPYIDELMFATTIMCPCEFTSPSQYRGIPLDPIAISAFFLGDLPSEDFSHSAHFKFVRVVVYFFHLNPVFS